MSETGSDEKYSDSPPHGNSTPVEKSIFSHSSRSISSSAHIESLETRNVMGKRGRGPKRQRHRSSLRSMSDPSSQPSSLQHPLKGSYISASSVPTHEDLYERRRRRPSNHRCNLSARVAPDCKESNQEHTHSHIRGSRYSKTPKESTASVKNQTLMETNPVENTEFVEVGEDALLKRMKKKEKEFDSKIREINQTFSSAGRQLVLRDDIIEALHREILELREQLDNHNVDNQQSREDERRLMESIQNNTHRLQVAQSHSKLEKDRLSAELDEYHSRCALQQAQIEQLREELEESHRVAHESRQHHTREIEKLRKHFHSQIREISTRYSKMDREHANMQEKVQEVEQTQRHAQAKVLQAQFELRQQRDQEGEIAKLLIQERNQLQEEVEVARLSIARLLSVLSCVPDMQNYLKWNEIHSEFVFLAYPTQYFPVSDRNLRQTTRDTALANNQIPRRYDTVDKGGDDYAKGYEVNTGSPLNIETNPQTGVEDGIYAGSTSFQKTKNIWLNGQWIKKLQEIVDSENMFTRLKKIKLLEMEEAARLCNQLPMAQDVLQCRRQEKDYWVPYEIFIEAQQFKNKYCPRVPVLSHFYPFLMKLNTIWGRKLQGRLLVLRKELQVAQQQAALQLKNKQQHPKSSSALPIFERDHHSSFHNDVARTKVSLDPLDEAARPSRRRNTHPHRNKSPLRQVHCRTFVLGASRNLNNLYNEHSRLRREVRLHITSQRSLSLFRYYDQLVKLAVSTIQQLVQLCEQADGEDAPCRERRANADDTSSEFVNSDESSVTDVPVLPPAPHGQREHDFKHSKHDAAIADSTRHLRATGELKPTNRTTTPDSSSIIALEQEAMKKEAAIEQLTRTIHGTCKRVGDITQALFTRTIACCVDLEKLMRMVQYKYIPKLYIRESRNQEKSAEIQQQKANTNRRALSKTKKKGSRVSSSCTTSSRSLSSLRESPGAIPVDTGSAHGPPSRGLSIQDIQQEVSGILRSRYAQGSVASRMFKKYGQLNEEAKDLQGCERARPQSGGPRGVEALSQVVASVLDFTSEVKSEVQNTHNTLETVLNQAVSESGACKSGR